jgi:hypothetical protein
MRSALSFSPHNAPIYIPPESPQFDYEGEIVIIIGKQGRRIRWNGYGLPARSSVSTSIRLSSASNR